MKRALLFLFLFAAAGAGAQTRELLRKSIGGATELPEVAGADFGLPHDYQETVTVVDSLIWITDYKALQVTSVYYKRQLRDARARPLYTNRDTIQSDYLLGQRHALDSIRAELRRRYPEGTQRTKYVGYDSLRKAVRPISKACRPAPKTGSKPDVRQHGSSAVLAAVAFHNDSEPPSSGPLFVAMTALFAAGLCTGIVRLYRRMVLPS